MTEYCDNNRRQILVLPISGRGVALIETVSAEMYRNLSAIESDENTLPVYFDTKGIRHDNVAIFSLGPILEKK